MLAVSPAPDSAPNSNFTVPVVYYKLPNGLRVIIVRNTLAPVAATAVNYLVGSEETPSGFPGTEDTIALNGQADAQGRDPAGQSAKSYRRCARGAAMAPI